MIRAIVPADIPHLKTVIDATGLFPSEMLDEMIAGYFSGTASQEIWLTLENPNPVAIAYCAPERMTLGTWNCLLIAVHPSQQSKGHGAALMTEIERTLQQRGERVLLVETSGLPEYERTRAFYDKRGYDRAARIPEFYNAGEDKIVFWKGLKP